MTKSPTWDFDLAIQFSKAYETDLLADNGNPTPLIPIPTQQPYHRPRSLGDFTLIFDRFNVQESPPFCSEKIEPVEVTTSLPSSYSSSLEPAEDYDDFVASKSKGVRWHDEIEVGSLPKEEMTSQTNGQAGRHLFHAHQDPDKAVGTGLEQGKPSSIKTPSPRKASRSSDSHDDREKIVIESKLHMRAPQQRARLIQRLRKRFPDPDSTFVTDPVSAALGIQGVVDPNGIHVFVDFSNIHIGFQNRMKAARGLHEKAYILQPPFSYHALSLILERGRPVARRVLAGSHYGHRKGSVDFREAELCGYETNILTRVEKFVPIVPVPRKRNGTGNGYATGTSGDESGMDLTKPVKTEQAVDEILQMKMLESCIDTEEPTTIVLASGDAAEAEYSGGFLKNVERALSKGWKVEVVAWNHGLSREYRNRDFLKKWGDKFKIIELDDFAEELLAVYV